MNRPCFLGAGIATHLGTGVAENVAALRRPSRPPQALSRRVDGREEWLPCRPLDGFSDLDGNARLQAVVETVVSEALREAGLSRDAEARMALFVGSSSFDIAASETDYRRELASGAPALPLRSSSYANLAESIRARFNLRGEDYTFNTACTASANGLLYAARLIRSEEVDHALVLGVELINDLTALGFLGLGLLSRTDMRPFDTRRDGLVLGEACSALVLGPGDAGRFRFLGGASRCDTHSMVAASEDGGTIAAVIEEALADADLPRSSVDAVKSHGTANPANDDAEAAGMHRVYEALPPVCALKPFIGHTLGASGLTEAVLLYRAVEAGFLAATPGIADAAHAIGVTLHQSERALSGGRFMLNSFGFGGSNASLLIGTE